jgi:N-acyl-D-amino-acid deacylase
MFNYLLPYEVWEQGPLAALKHLREPAVRERLEALLECFMIPVDKIAVAWTATRAGARWQGKTLAQLAAETARRPADALCDLLIDENLAALSVLHTGDDAWIERFLRHDKFMLGTDGIYFADGLVHPRVWGSAPRMLGPLVRDKRWFTLEHAVRAMSGAAAERFGLVDRGEVREGAFADLVLFNSETVADLATYEDPHRPPVGIEHVFTNGVEIIRHGRAVENLGPDLPGRALRFKE